MYKRDLITRSKQRISSYIEDEIKRTNRIPHSISDIRIYASNTQKLFDRSLIAVTKKRFSSSSCIAPEILPIAQQSYTEKEKITNL